MTSMTGTTQRADSFSEANERMPRQNDVKEWGI